LTVTSALKDTFLPLFLIVVVAYLIYREIFVKRRLAKRVKETTEVLKSDFPFIFPAGMKLLCMDRWGDNLRFISLSSHIPVQEIFSSSDQGPIVKTRDLTVPVASIISVELFRDSVNETTTTKKNAVGRAVVGALLFGGVGAIVGSTSAGSQSHTVSKPGSVSELVFELSDLANPVVRFLSTDHAQCELWLHRVRSAMAMQKGHSAGVHSQIAALDRA
jgi:hypothetical protein